MAFKKIKKSVKKVTSKVGNIASSAAPYVAAYYTGGWSEVAMQAYSAATATQPGVGSYTGIPSYQLDQSAYNKSRKEDEQRQFRQLTRKRIQTEIPQRFESFRSQVAKTNPGLADNLGEMEDRYVTRETHKQFKTQGVL